MSDNILDGLLGNLGKDNSLLLLIVLLFLLGGGNVLGDLGNIMSSGSFKTRPCNT